MKSLVTTSAMVFLYSGPLSEFMSRLISVSALWMFCCMFWYSLGILCL